MVDCFVCFNSYPVKCSNTRWYRSAIYSEARIDKKELLERKKTTLQSFLSRRFFISYRLQVSLLHPTTPLEIWQMHHNVNARLCRHFPHYCAVLFCLSLTNHLSHKSLLSFCTKSYTALRLCGSTHHTLGLICNWSLFFFAPSLSLALALSCMTFIFLNFFYKKDEMYVFSYNKQPNANQPTVCV